MKKLVVIFLAALTTSSSHVSASQVVDCFYVETEVHLGMKNYKRYTKNLMNTALPDEFITEITKFQRENAITTNMLTNVYNTFCKD